MYRSGWRGMSGRLVGGVLNPCGLVALLLMQKVVWVRVPSPPAPLLWRKAPHGAFHPYEASGAITVAMNGMPAVFVVNVM